MTSGIRHSKPVPAFSAISLRVGGKSVEGWTRFAGILEDFLRRLVDTGSGSPGAHGSTHAPGTGADPLDTAAPSNPTGTAASEGSADTLLRSDCTIKQGIVTAKGDLLGFSTVPAKLAVGADDFVLTADSGEALGIKWAAATGGGGDPALDTEVWMPLTTVVAGVPDLVWDGDDSLIPTLVPI